MAKIPRLTEVFKIREAPENIDQDAQSVFKPRTQTRLGGQDMKPDVGTDFDSVDDYRQYNQQSLEKMDSNALYHLMNQARYDAQNEKDPAKKAEANVQFKRIKAAYDANKSSGASTQDPAPPPPPQRPPTPWADQLGAEADADDDKNYKWRTSSNGNRHRVYIPTDDHISNAW
jgi:hypothetical protein